MGGQKERDRVDFPPQDKESQNKASFFTTSVMLCEPKRHLTILEDLVFDTDLGPLVNVLPGIFPPAALQQSCHFGGQTFN